MQRPNWLVFLVALLTASSLASGQLSLEPSPTPDENVKLLRWLDRADVKADFRRLVSREHDTRFIAVYGFTTIIPGTDDQRDSALIRRHGEWESGSVCAHCHHNL
ncbi:MAG: hypothetical protein H0W34_13485 [Pyrinomonadaceae bacterium]|nr:hypothetical protein [Pyrinomonadaceae bacterium]